MARGSRCRPPRGYDPEDIAAARRYGAETVREQDLPLANDWMRFVVDASLSPDVRPQSEDGAVVMGDGRIRVRQLPISQ